MADAKILTPNVSPGLERLIQFWRAVESEQSESTDIVHSWRPAPNVDVLSLHSVGQAGTAAGAKRPDLQTRVGAWIERRAKHLVARRAGRLVMTAPKNMAEAAVYRFSPDACVPVGCREAFLARDQPNNDSGPRVLMVGRVEPAKRQDFIAAATPDEYSLVFAGPVRDKQYARNLPESTHLIGEMSDSELRDQYQRADIVVVPSRHEGFSLTAVEAMAAETPVVVSDGCGIADLVRQHRSGTVFNVNQARSYQVALKRVTDERRDMAKRAHSFVASELIWPAIAAQYEDLYNEVCSEA
jgi:glycosyltransferase involved in cell wall biosynthesis